MTIARIRPSKPISAIAAIVGTVFAIAGLAGTIWIFGWAPQGWPFGLFLCLWTFVAGSISGYHWINVFSSSGASMLEADIQSIPAASASSARLRELNDLKAQGLISDDEYRLKRDEVIKNL